MPGKTDDVADSASDREEPSGGPNLSSAEFQAQFREAFRRLLRRLMRVTFVSTKVTKSSFPASAPELRSGSLRCSVRVGSAELAAFACALSAQTCSGPSPLAPALLGTLEVFKVKTEAATESIRPRFSSVTWTDLGFDRKQDLGSSRRSLTSPMSIGWLGLAFDLSRRQRRRRRGAAGGKRAVACLSGGSVSDRSEFDRPRQP
jgi:hypothetical protein